MPVFDLAAGQRYLEARPMVVERSPLPWYRRYLLEIVWWDLIHSDCCKGQAKKERISTHGHRANVRDISRYLV